MVGAYASAMKLRPDGSSPASSIVLSGPASRPQPSSCMASSTPPPNDRRPSGGRDRTLQPQSADTTPTCKPITTLGAHVRDAGIADWPASRRPATRPLGRANREPLSQLGGCGMKRPDRRLFLEKVFTTLAMGRNRAESSWRAKRVARAWSVGEAMLLLKPALSGRLHGRL